MTDEISNLLGNMGIKSTEEKLDDANEKIIVLEKLLKESRLDLNNKKFDFSMLKTLNKAQHGVIQKLLPKKPSGSPPGIIDNILIKTIEEQRAKEEKVYIWGDSHWGNISKLENNNFKL